MGRETRNFRQSNRSLSGNRGAQNYAPIIRQGSWYGKIASLLKVRGKGENNGKS